jgi:DNA-binding NtrC family response regulator
MSCYEWPGNVRELANAIEGAMTFGTDTLIRFEDLPAPISRIEPSSSTHPQRLQASGPALGTFAEVERDLIRRALETCEWNKVHAAAMLKISRKKLYAKIDKYRLERTGERTENEE